MRRLAAFLAHCFSIWYNREKKNLSQREASKGENLGIQVSFLACAFDMNREGTDLNNKPDACNLAAEDCLIPADIVSVQDGIPRPEYPRPQFVRENWMNLNGTWAFEID